MPPDLNRLEAGAPPEPPSPPSKARPVLSARDLRKWYPGPTTWRNALARRRSWVKAVDQVSFDLWPGEILGVIGESGCGKSTLGRTLTRLEDATAGSVIFDGRDMARLGGADLKDFRRRAQIVFQNPYESFDGRYTVKQSLERPLLIHGLASGHEERQERILAVLAAAGLRPPEAFAERYPHELSGGQLQRVSLARVMLLDPEFVVADEPVSMLDVSVRAGILNMLLDLRRERRASLLFITHDIGVARYVSDRVLVMYLGKVVEAGPAGDVIADPLHPYTAALISHSPDPDPDNRRKPVPVTGEPPTPLDPGPGCRFAPRCAAALPVCFEAEPPLRGVGSGPRVVACHRLGHGD